jgi:PAS domain S-box-containing protein
MNELSGDAAGAATVVGREPPRALGRSVDADAAALGVSVLAEVVTSVDDGIAVIDAEQRWVYANRAACRMLGQPFDRLAGRDFLGSVEARAHAGVPSDLPDRLHDRADPFAFSVLDAGGVVREIVCSIFALETSGQPQRVAILKDLTGPRAEARTAAALAQTAAQLAGAGTTAEILVGLARHGVEGTRALAIGTIVVGDDRKLIASGGYGYPAQEASREAWAAASVTIDDLPGGEPLLVGQTVVSPDARTRWEASAVLAPFAVTLTALDWQAAIYVPLTWEGKLLGLLGAYLPSGVAAPSEQELAFYTALADQSAVAVINARLAASVERTRLARELHDSVSQALFSMTMHARAAQLSMVKAGLDPDAPMGRSITELAELTRGALAEMRALIFELRPGALAEEGLVAALQKQGAALTAREQVAITVDGPEQRLDLSGAVEEHLYRVASEALHNVVKHAGANHASVHVSIEGGALKLVVGDDGAGFDPELVYAGHLGLSTMGERAAVIGADLTIASAPADGTTVTVTLPYTASDRGAVPDAH